MNEILREASDIISDPLRWQEAMDNAPSGINMRGSLRFWNTVASLGLECVYTDGAPEFSEIVFRLQGNIGLRLWTERINAGDFAPDDSDIPVWIRFAFCEIADEGDA